MVEPAGLIGYDISKPANRVCSRRWPHAELFGDVREIDEKVVVSWSLKYPHIVEIHLWGGFPCVGLSSVRYMRKNLAGPQSGLFREILRVLELLRKIFGRNFKILFFVENVASMDRSAAEEVSQALGVIPYRLQCSQAVPISRPRYCWTNLQLPLLAGVFVSRKEYYIDVEAPAPYPQLDQRLTEGHRWDGADEGEVFPTCMKCIRRHQPPPAPAGLSRTPSSAAARWESDSFAYPPYQYKRQYVIWSEQGWRLLNS